MKLEHLPLWIRDLVIPQSFYSVSFNQNVEYEKNLKQIYELSRKDIICNVLFNLVIDNYRKSIILTEMDKTIRNLKVRVSSLEDKE